jgi:mono/diheme cytochrome c family protein
MSSRAFAKAARMGLAAVGLIAGLAALGGSSLAQSAANQNAANAPAAAPAAPGAVNLDKGRQLFTDYGCANCHSLGDAGATGHVGPSLDGNPNITLDFVKDRVTNGQGMMPSFASQLTADEINTVSAYVAKVAMK